MSRQNNLTRLFLVLFLSSYTLYGQADISTGEELLTWADTPIFSLVPQTPEPISVHKELQAQLDVLYTQLDQVTQQQDRLTDRYAELLRLQKASLDEADALDQMAKANPTSDPTAPPPYRQTILLLQQQVSHCDEQLRDNAYEQRMQQLLAEDIEDQIAHLEETLAVWATVETEEAVSP